MEASTQAYLAAVRVMRDNARDEYDRIWWKIEFETVSAGIGLTATNMHKRVMRALSKKRQPRPHKQQTRPTHGRAERGEYMGVRPTV